ncbi:MAG: 6-carboxytetrahydropterin synthase QueD [Smithellaceae bacterium]|nr:6-carboxytetrahydropterin synthase QueD [Syntrophaceae bacterium]MDD4241018.1 6-carboxytetrahydropterin synthase QueD [Smithellaceae bacterium]NLX53051.1 6-carboxytetrahydropterin synthase QueD [Deltaproteobacteria bacterium]
MKIFKVFKFDAAHYLPRVPAGHPCARIHGHSFRVEIHLQGIVDARAGWVTDFADITAAVSPVLEQLDHKHLNDIDGLENPTSENLCRWIWPRLKPALPGLCKIIVQESPESGCIYRGED